MLAVIEHLYGELQEVDEARQQDQGNDQQKQQLGQQGLPVLTALQFGMQLHRITFPVGPGYLVQQGVKAIQVHLLGQVATGIQDVVVRRFHNRKITIGNHVRVAAYSYAHYLVQLSRLLVSYA